MKQGQYSELGNSQYQLMTSVSMPVYDLRHNEVSSSSCCKLALIYLSPMCLRICLKYSGKRMICVPTISNVALLNVYFVFSCVKFIFSCRQIILLSLLLFSCTLRLFQILNFPCSMNQINLSSVSKRCVYRLVLYFLLIGRKLYLF